VEAQRYAAQSTAEGASVATVLLSAQRLPDAFAHAASMPALFAQMLGASARRYSRLRVGVATEFVPQRG